MGHCMYLYGGSSKKLREDRYTNQPDLKHIECLCFFGEV